MIFSYYNIVKRADNSPICNISSANMKHDFFKEQFKTFFLRKDVSIIKVYEYAFPFAHGDEPIPSDFVLYGYSVCYNDSPIFFFNDFKTALDYHNRGCKIIPCYIHKRDKNRAWKDRELEAYNEIYKAVMFHRRWWKIKNKISLPFIHKHPKLMQRFHTSYDNNYKLLVKHQLESSTGMAFNSPTVQLPIIEGCVDNLAVLREKTKHYKIGESCLK
jgi:hypothetical protein